MKKWILSAAIVLAVNGFAAAQTTRAQEVPKTQKTAVKKGTTLKTTTKNPEKKDAEVKEEVAVLPTKLKIVLPEVDTTGIPVKGKQ